MPDFLQQLFSSDGFMPHGHCYLWNPGLVWLHVVSDALISLAYTSIPFTLVYFGPQAKGHSLQLDVLLLWDVHHRLRRHARHGDMDAAGRRPIGSRAPSRPITAAASVPTAALLVKLVPQALAIPTAEQLSKAHEELRKAHEVLESRVKERTAELTQKNEELSKEMSNASAPRKPSCAETPNENISR